MEKLQATFVPLVIIIIMLSDLLPTRNIAQHEHRANTQCGHSGCTFIGAKIWNNISTDLKRMSKLTFSKQLKKKYFVNIDCEKNV